MKRLLKLYFEKPALVAFALLIAARHLLLDPHQRPLHLRQNVQGLMSLFPELAIVAIGFALLMIAGEFDLSIGSMFGFMPMVVCTLSSRASASGRPSSAACSPASSSA